MGQSKSVPLEPGELFVSIAATVGKPMITKIKCCIQYIRTRFSRGG